MSAIDESHGKRDLLIHVLHDSHDRKTIKPLRWLVWSESSLSTLILLLGWERGLAHRCYQVKKTNGDYPTERKKRKKEKKTHARIQEFSSGGVQVSLTKNTEVKWPISKKSLFFKVPEGVQHFPGGGSNFFQGGGWGVQLLIPYRNPYNLWFSRGVRTPCPPPPPLGGSHLYIATLSCINVDG